LIEALTHACNEYLAKALPETALTTLWVVCSENGQVDQFFFTRTGVCSYFKSIISPCNPMYNGWDDTTSLPLCIM